MGISEEEIEGNIPKSDRQFRLEAIHIRGFDGSIVRSEDIHEYFSEFSPVSFEWVDKNSANVIWALPASAAKALLTLSRPLKKVILILILLLRYNFLYNIYFFRKCTEIQHVTFQYFTFLGQYIHQQ